jgi:hypothetical protein
MLMGHMCDDVPAAAKKDQRAAGPKHGDQNDWHNVPPLPVEQRKRAAAPKVPGCGCRNAQIMMLNANNSSQASPVLDYFFGES